MQTRCKLKPGARGTKNLVRQYGDRLVCVRYRYDAERKRRIKTIELIVDEATWNPEQFAHSPEDPVYLHVLPQETEVRQRIKEAGGRWHPDIRQWSLPFKNVITLGYQHRVDEAPTRHEKAEEDHPW